ncbi:acyltransferase [Lysobacter arenosi]|uniref:Acyltransferase n=1 Tax=Lysobacter arenosi TaxID=2795387 RepID=A0ABX7RD17_9GAMM|nr:acyltransferase [Lysobacter arenosi]QSX76040.1 acyltransferase [Lysobacter arenosi]
MARSADEIQLRNPNSGRFAHIDAMRAFAVMLVVVSHTGLRHIVPGGSGVTIFFCISGFIITHLVLKEHAGSGGFDVGRFYLRRFLKLAPPFFLIVVVPTVIYSLWNPVRFTDFLAQVFFVFNWVDIAGNPRVLPGSTVVWSLAVEEQFYIGFALLWFWLVRSPKRLAWLAIIASAVAIASLLMRIHITETAFSHDRTYFGTDTRMDGIAIGVLSAVIFFWLEQRSGRGAMLRRILGSDWIVVFAVGGYLFSLVYRDEYFRETYRYSIQAMVAASLVVYGLIQKESWLRRLVQRVAELRPVQIVGLASYSIYLVHLSIYELTSSLFAGWPKPLAVTALSVSGVAVGVIIWRFVELPVERFKKRQEAGRVAACAVSPRVVRSVSLTATGGGSQ